MVLMRNNTTHLLSQRNSTNNNHNTHNHNIHNNNNNTRVGANNTSNIMAYANNSRMNYYNYNNYYDNTLIGTIASQSFLKLNRHCRPKIVKKNEYVLKSIYP